MSTAAKTVCPKLDRRCIFLAMSYELEAYLAPLKVLEGKQKHPVPELVYRLTDALGLVPLCGTVHLDESWPVRASRGTTVARVSAAYFGGYGSQSATVWSDGTVVAENVDVNVALRHLGVRKSGGEDEWDSVGLGTLRRTETWAAEVIRAKRKAGDKPLENLLIALRYTAANSKQQEKVRSAAAWDLGAASWGASPFVINTPRSIPTFSCPANSTTPPTSKPMSNPPDRKSKPSSPPLIAVQMRS